MESLTGVIILNPFIQLLLLFYFHIILKLNGFGGSVLIISHSKALSYSIHIVGKQLPSVFIIEGS
ncbi:MAG: hypothetical protein IK042_00965, partial [Bacteroidales bacterium]|nr:hypothetical protein [Bacteroidales bacterium]